MRQLSAAIARSMHPQSTPTTAIATSPPTALAAPWPAPRPAATSDAAAPQGGLNLLARSARGADLDDLAGRFEALAHWLQDDLVALEDGLLSARAAGPTTADSAARHLLAQPGKRLRPLLVLLAGRMAAAPPAGPTADRRSALRDLAIAAELAHAATLLHDDVIDHGDTRRGAATARALHGNAASVLGGDLVLVEALRRVEAAAVPGALAELIEVIAGMVEAEALQLLRRGALTGDAGRGERYSAAGLRADWQQIAEGKTAALFAWAARVGGRAGGLSPPQVAALSRYGLALGLAFQLADDALDIAGDPTLTGKPALADLREGRPSWPLVLALEAEPALRVALQSLAGDADRRGAPAAGAPATGSAEAAETLRAAIVASGAVEATWARAEALADDAECALGELPPGQARAALCAVARAAVRRRT